MLRCKNLDILNNIKSWYSHVIDQSVKSSNKAVHERWRIVAREITPLTLPENQQCVTELNPISILQRTLIIDR
jgi:hypothetical protein